MKPHNSISNHNAKVLIVIPCYNEASSIQSVLEDIHQDCPEFDTLVIDDASSDETAIIAGKYTNCIRLPMNLGIGGAVQTGIKYARRRHYDLCIQVDGDGQHPSSQIRQMVKSYFQTRCNIIIGSRFLAPQGFQSTWLRRRGIGLICGFINRVFGVKITDPTSGFRLMDRKAMDLFARHYEKDFPEPISNALVIKAGLTFQEHPVTMESRRGGMSSISGIVNFLYMLRVMSHILFIKLGKKAW